MATYSRPGGATIRAYTRLKGQAFGHEDGTELSDAELETELEGRVESGEDDVFTRVGAGYETNTGLTARQVRHLQRAVCYRTAMVFLHELLVDHAGGTHQPLLSDPELLNDLIERYESQAEGQEGLLQGEAALIDTPPFAMPAAVSGGFSVTDSDRTVTERNLLTDLADDVSPFAVEVG